MTTQSITSQSITSSMMALLVRTSEVKNKPLYQVVEEYQKQAKVIANEANRIKWFSEEDLDNEENAEAEEIARKEEEDYNQWSEDFDNNPRGYWN